MISSIDPTTITAFNIGECTGDLPCEHSCTLTFQSGENRTITLDAAQIWDFLHKVPVDKVKSAWERIHFEGDYQLLDDSQMWGPQQEQKLEAEQSKPKTPTPPPVPDFVLEISSFKDRPLTPKGPLSFQDEPLNFPSLKELDDANEMQPFLRDEELPIINPQLNQRGKIVDVALRAVEQPSPTKVARQKRYSWCCCWW